ncbi:hypothetical protein D3879_14885 [Pseudomonas cavernicola]|uniref:Uncharacterized protein n=1 Tax=Pseudomonas cavernicola TaxID=2320866 RepID=A0A418XEK8_9PSED|nr:hypothetical protein [Pseudomonas cavernicola]RJG10961.1 hypothetical protein D3879_14885 [Pseudomonas cavernicola]
MKRTPLEVIEREIEAAKTSAHPPTTISYASGMIVMAEVSCAITHAQASELERRLHTIENAYWAKQLGVVA